MSDAPRLLETVEAGVLTLTLNRPRVLNALDRPLIADLRAALARARADAGVRVVVVAGAGGCFSAGADIGEMTAIGTHAEGVAWTRPAHDLLDELATLPQPVIARIEGICVGGGQELALACDFRIAGEGARFGQVEVNIGSIASWGGTQRLARTVGQPKAKELALLGEQFPASEALAIGLVHRVVPDGRLDEEIRSWCARLSAKPASALAATKLSIHRALDGTLRENLDRDAEVFADLALGTDLREGVAAFLEKRPPRWG